MATDGWYGPAIANYAASDAPRHVSTVDKGILHKTVSSPGSFRPRSDSYFGHQSYPHFTTDVQHGKFVVWQHISIRKAAKALKNLSGGVQTNTDGCVQIEIVGQADTSALLHPVRELHDIHQAGLRDLMRWIESETEIPRSTPVEFHQYPPENGIRLGREPWRLSPAAWTAAKGWLGHQHVPENSHGDPGTFDIKTLLALPPAAAPDVQEDEMKLFVFSADGLDWGTDGLSRRPFESQDAKTAWIQTVEKLGGRVERITLTAAQAESLVVVMAGQA